MAGSNRYQLVAPVRRRHRHALRLARRHFRIEYRNPNLLRRMFQRIDDQESVVAPVDAVDRPVGVSGGVAFVGRQLVVRERCRTTPVPHSQYEIALDTLRTRRHRRDVAARDPIRPAGEHVETAPASQAGHHVAHALAVLPDLDACIPCRHARRERPERFRDLARRLVAHLMTDVAVGLDLVDPVVLRAHLGRDTVAGRSCPRKFLLGWNVNQRDQ